MEMMVISKVNYNRFNGKFGRNAVILAVNMSIICINSNIDRDYGHIIWNKYNYGNTSRNNGDDGHK